MLLQSKYQGLKHLLVLKGNLSCVEVVMNCDTWGRLAGEEVPARLPRYTQQTNTLSV